MSVPAELPLAAAQARLGRPGRPRKARPVPAEPPDSRHDAGTTAAQTHVKTGAEHRPLTSPVTARLLDVVGAAVYLSVSTWTVRDLHAAGRLPRVRLPMAGDRECRRLLFDVRDLDQLIETAKEGC